MPNLKDLKAQFQQWRQDLYDCFFQRPDTLMDLLNARNLRLSATLRAGTLPAF